MAHRKHAGAEYGRKSRKGQERLSLEEGKHHRAPSTKRVRRPTTAAKQSDRGHGPGKR